MDKGNTWKFEAKCEKDIDWDLIYNELSKKNPVVSVYSDKRPGRVSVIFHHSIDEKVFYCRGGEKMRKELYELVGNHDVWVPYTNVSKIIKLIRKIKAAPYKKKYAEKMKVSVRLEKV